MSVPSLISWHIKPFLVTGMILKSKYAIKHIYNAFENKYSSISIGTFYLTNTEDIKTSKRLPKNELCTLYF